jgi:hypothetical protein
MKRSFLSFCVLALIHLPFTLKGELPENYQSLNPKEKQNILWENIMSSQWAELPSYSASSSWGGWSSKLSSVWNLGKTFSHASDEMPEGRVRFIHEYGSCGTIAFVPDSNHPFTGIFKQGAYGLARLSLATAPTEDKFVPGMALKFFIQGHESLNLHVMNSLEGQGSDWNFFSRPFSNSIPEPSTFMLKVGAFIFSLVHTPPHKLPVAQMAMINPDGSDVVLPIVPSTLLFHPTAYAQSLNAGGEHVDPRIMLSKVIPGNELYDVLASDESGKNGTVWFKVGTIILTSPFVASEYGDKTLFFRHMGATNSTESEKSSAHKKEL